jgi:quinol---cytochrome-c reductase cytochrome c subunit
MPAPAAKQDCAGRVAAAPPEGLTPNGRLVAASARSMFIRLVHAVLLIPFILQFALCQTPGAPAVSASSAPTGTAAPTAPAPDGQAVFLQRCSKCHGEHGEGVNAVVTFAGPSLQAEHDPGRVMMAVEVGPSHMPSFAHLLSVGEIHAVADYVTEKLAVIPLTGGNLAEGGRLFRKYCAPCHRTAVRGGALAFADTNAPALTGKSASLVAGAIRWGPGPMPSFPSAVLTDRQVASITDYVVFVEHPPSPGGTPLNWYGPVAEGFVAWVIVFGLLGITRWIEKGGSG